MNKHIWSNYLNVLPSTLHTIAPDLYGHGERRSVISPVTRSEPACTARFLANDILSRHAELQKPAEGHASICIVGHSLGGLVALELEELLSENGWEDIRLLLGDSPIFPCGDTDSQQSAIVELQKSSLGINLLINCFAGFGQADESSLAAQEDKLNKIARRSSLTYLAGDRGPHQRLDGAWDCGTFLSIESRTRLHRLAGEGLSVAEIKDAGHFVFHSLQGHSYTMNWIRNNC